MTNRNASSLSALPPTPAEISLVDEGAAIVMRTDDGFALYRYDRDVEGQSRCMDACSREWPPVLASDSAQRVGDWAAIKRSDNSVQWTFRGKPVYTYSRDVPGGTKGNGVGGVWHLVTP